MQIIAYSSVRVNRVRKGFRIVATGAGTINPVECLEKFGQLSITKQVDSRSRADRTRALSYAQELMASRRVNSRTTSFDVAALAGVSQSAVSRAFTPGSSIAEDTRERVIEAARKLNYVPNSIASSLTTKRTNIVALILGNLANPFYVQALHEFSVRLQARGRQVLIFTVDPGAESDDAIMRALQYQIDGIILTSAQISTRMTAICHERGIPIVLFNRYIPGSDASGVRCDNVAGGRLIGETFLAAGARTFAMMTGDPRGTTSQDRVRGFVERLLEDGVKRNQIVEVAGGSTYDGAVKAARAVFGDDNSKPDA